MSITNDAGNKLRNIGGGEGGNLGGGVDANTRLVYSMFFFSS